MTLSKALTRWLTAELASRTGFRWDPSIARYRDNSTGRLVSERAVFRAADGFREFTKENIAGHTRRFLDGQIDVATWQERVAREVKDAHIVSHMAGRGGRNTMTMSDWGKVGSRLRFEYQQLDAFAQEIKAGTLSAAQIQARATLYGNGAHKAFYDGKTRAGIEAGFTEERRRTTPGEVCADCVGYEAQGWVPIGSLPEPGEGSVCRANCRCRKEYR